MLEFIKASKSEEMMDKVIHNNPMFTQLDNEAVSTINVFTGIQIPVKEEKGKMDMCKAWEDHRMSGLLQGKKEGKIEGKIEGKEIVNRLNICLIKDGRQDDLIKAASDSVYQEELIQYYELDKD